MSKVRHERFLACISSNEATARKIIRKTARLARYYQSKWFVLYVQTPNESLDKIPLDKQRHLINNFQLAVELGAEVLQAQAANRLNRWLVPVAIPLKAINVAVPDIGKAILEVVREKQITTICIGKPHLTFWQIVLHTGIFNQLLRALKENEVDVVILS